jgi:hypothetical protein
VGLRAAYTGLLGGKMLFLDTNSSAKYLARPLS